MVLESTSGTLIGKIPAGTDTYIHNAGFVWLVLLIPLSIAAWLGMDNIRAKHVSPGLGAPPMAFFQIAVMLLIGLGCRCGRAVADAAGKRERIRTLGLVNILFCRA